MAIACGFLMTPVYADGDQGVGSDDAACANYRGDKNDPNYKALCSGEGEDEVRERVRNILSTIFIWAGIIAVIVLIIGGIYYTISQGDPGKVKKAKETIMYAIIGLIVVSSAFAIVNFTLGAIQK